MKLSVVGLGCRSLGGQCTINNISTTFGDISEKAAFELIDKSIKLGINVFDTADNYSLGKSEERLGKILKNYRKEVYIFTKAGSVVSHSNHPFQMDLSYHHLISSLNRSLKRLNTEYVDLFQTHGAPKTESDFTNIEKAFNKIKSDGTALFCGVSVGKDYNAGIDLIKRNLVDALQITFSLIFPQPLTELLPIARKNKIGIIVNRPLAEGLLTNNFLRKNFKNNDVRKTYSKNYFKQIFKQIKKFKTLKKSLSLNQLALGYILSRKEVTACIPGVKNITQLISNVNASQIQLNKVELKEIQNVQKQFRRNS